MIQKRNIYTDNSQNNKNNYIFNLIIIIIIIIIVFISFQLRQTAQPTYNDHIYTLETPVTQDRNNRFYCAEGVVGCQTDGARVRLLTSQSLTRWRHQGTHRIIVIAAQLSTPKG